MKIKKNGNGVSKKVIAAVATLAVATTLTGCNYNLFDTKYEFDTAIVFNYSDDSATIFSIESWNDYDGEQLQIETTDGTWFVTSSFDTKLMNSEDSKYTPEDFVESILGDDAEIRYFGDAQPQR